MRARRGFLPVAALAACVAGCGLAHDGCSLVRAAGAARRLPGPSDPIPAGGPTFAASTDAALLEAWYDRVFLDSYRRVGRRSAVWDGDVETLIRASAPRVLYQSKEAPVADLLARERTLRKAGCDDPLVLFLAALAEDQSDRNSRTGIELLEKSVAAFHDARYPRAVAFRVAEALRRDYAWANEGTGKREALAPVERRWFFESLDDGSYGPRDGVVLGQGLARGHLSTFFDANRAAIVQAISSRAWVDPWLRLYLSGEKAISDAWDARGGLYADKVTQPGWKGFEDSLAEARRNLTASWKAKKDRPEPPAAMIVVAMAAGQPDESPRLWFDRSVSAQFDYEPAYWALLYALTSRWSGDPSALIGFAGACAATRRFDTTVPLMAFEATEYAEWDRIIAARPTDPETDEPLLLRPSRRPPSLYRDATVYDTVAGVLERYRREPGQPSDWTSYAALQAAIAFKAGRYEDARRFFRDAGRVLTAKARDAVGVAFLGPRIEAYAGPDGPSLRRAEELYDAGHPADAAPLFAAALAHAEPAARPYLEDQSALTSTESELAAGHAVRFLPPSGLAGWDAQEGLWTVDKDGSLVGTSGARGLFIVAKPRVGPDFEIEADVEVVSTSNGQYQAGIVFGDRPSQSSNRWSSFRWKKTAHEGEVAYFSHHFNRPVRSVAAHVPLQNHVVIRSWNGQLWAWLNGTAVVEDYAPEWRRPRSPDDQVGFGAYVDDNTCVLRYRNVTLRRLTTALPAGRGPD